MRGRVDRQRNVGMKAARGKAANGKRLPAASDRRRTQFGSPKSVASKKRASAVERVSRNKKGSVAHKAKRSFTTNNLLTGSRTTALMKGPCDIRRKQWQTI